MNKNQKEHLDFIVKTLVKRLKTKYEKGAKEHKGDLFDVDCLDEAIDELVDALVYLLTLKRKQF